MYISLNKITTTTITALTLLAIPETSYTATQCCLCNKDYSDIGPHMSQATEMQTLCWSKTRPSFSGADNSYIS